MSYSTRRWGRLRVAPVLLLVLTITTGWVQAASYTPPSPRAAVGHPPADVTQPVSGAIEITGSGPQVRMAPPRRPTVAVRVPVPVAAPVAAKVKGGSSHASAPAANPYTGRNHFWFPALRISRPVYSYPCSRKRAPDNLVYRWGCAGYNNVYLLGHAYGVMKPLHDAYVSGRLHTGMLAVYADGNGRVRTYRVTTWRVVSPTNPTWAEASQPVPSMTLQTCVGTYSQWRLIVRLVAIR